MLKPAYTCDKWFQKKRLCEEWRNVGSTVTFTLATPPPEMVGRVKIEWFQRFHFLNQTAKEKNITYLINPKDPPWNMVIGSGGLELRISPISESDIMVNYFTAVAHFERGSPKRKLNFAIQTMPTDIGVVYPGDTVTIHMPSYVSLPAESMTYNWQMEGVSIFLPSNMRPSRSGASLTVFELRKEQEGILACAVFTNLGIFATQKRFVIKNVESENSKLIFVATRPPHKFIPLALWNAEIGSLMESISQLYGTRFARNLPNDIYQLDPKLRKQLLSKMPKLKKYLAENYNLTNKRIKRSPQPPESPDYFIEPVDSQKADANIKPDFYLPNEQPELPFLARNLNKRQGDETPEREEDDKFSMADERKERYSNEEDEPETTNTSEQGGYFGDFDSDEDKRFEQEARNAETPPTQERQQSKPLSFLEQHEPSEPRRKQMKITKKRLHTSAETSETVDEELLQERDYIAMLLSECHRDSQCALNAECIKRRKGKPGFCRCRPKFEGNGIFCWENDKSVE